MRRKLVGVLVGVAGVLVSRLGPDIWRTSPDELWAAVAVVSVLSGTAIVLEATISRLMSSLTHVNRNER